MKRWSPDEDAHLREWWLSRRVAVIAKTLGRSQNSIIGRAYRLGLSRIKREDVNWRIAKGVERNLRGRA